MFKFLKSKDLKDYKYYSLFKIQQRYNHILCVSAAVLLSNNKVLFLSWKDFVN